MAKARTMRDENNNIVYPQTAASVVYTADGNTVNDIILKGVSVAPVASVSQTPEVTENKVTSLSSTSSNTQYPSAKATYDFVLANKSEGLKIEVVQVLPTTDIDTKTLYLVPKAQSETGDSYDEYIYVNNQWEHLGSTDMKIGKDWNQNDPLNGEYIKNRTHHVEKIENQELINTETEGYIKDDYFFIECNGQNITKGEEYSLSLSYDGETYLYTGTAKDFPSSGLLYFGNLFFITGEEEDDTGEDYVFLTNEDGTLIVNRYTPAEEYSQVQIILIGPTMEYYKLDKNYLSIFDNDGFALGDHNISYDNSVAESNSIAIVESHAEACSYRQMCSMITGTVSSVEPSDYWCKITFDVLMSEYPAEVINKFTYLFLAKDADVEDNMDPSKVMEILDIEISEEDNTGYGWVYNLMEGVPHFEIGDDIVIGYYGNTAFYNGHAEGVGTLATEHAHAEGNVTRAHGDGAHAEGAWTVSFNSGHAEGYGTIAFGDSGSHAEGKYTKAIGAASHVEGYNSRATGGYGAHAEGYYTDASGESSHAEGEETEASGEGSHTEGYHTKASGDYGSHAEGYYTRAAGQASHVEGYYTTAYGHDGAHAEGYYTTADSDQQHVQGKYNVVDDRSVYADIIGNGIDQNNKKNIEATTWTGDKRLKGDVYVHCNNDSTGGIKLTPLPAVTSADAGKFFSVDNSGNIVLVSLSVYNGEVV